MPKQHRVKEACTFDIGSIDGKSVNDIHKVLKDQVSLIKERFPGKNADDFIFCVDILWDEVNFYFEFRRDETEAETRKRVKRTRPTSKEVE